MAEETEKFRADVKSATLARHFPPRPRMIMVAPNTLASSPLRLVHIHGIPEQEQRRSATPSLHRIAGLLTCGLQP